MPVSSEDLAAGGVKLTNAVIEAFAGDANFEQLGQQCLEQLLARDKEDEDKLAKGIQLAVDKKVLPAEVDVEPVTTIFADGRTPEEVTEDIIKALGDAPSKGCVMTLQGLSGTGKGTTTDMLKEKLPNAQTWSNGNIFRSLTLLAHTYAEKNGCTIQDTLTPELLKEFMGYLTFDKFGDQFDTKIEGLGLKYMVSEVANTELKAPTVGKNIPTVAEKTQGEVILFIQNALAKMTAGGVNVLLEGRTQTINHIRTPHRFELTLKDMSVVGKRQAALTIGAKVKQTIGSVTDTDAIKAALDKEIQERLEANAAAKRQKSD
jgi:cytidylate kinase